MFQHDVVVHSRRFRPRDLFAHLHAYGVNRRDAAVQTISRDPDQTDLLVYAAVSGLDYETGDATTIATVIVVSIHHCEDSHWVTSTHYSEDEMPLAATCPQHILALLDEPRTDLAQQWRERCREFLSALTPATAFAAA